MKNKILCFVDYYLPGYKAGGPIQSIVNLVENLGDEFEFYNYLQARQLGCHIITIPPSIIEKIQNFGKSFDRLTIETVKAFLVDSNKSKFNII